MKRQTKISFSIVIAMMILTGCAPKINQDNIIQNRFDLNDAVIRSWDEQMLLNLVRMRYRDNPMFLEVGNIVAYQSMKVTGNVGGGLSLAPQNTGTASIGTSGELILAPTLTYAPLQGEEFARRMLSPIPPATIFLLSQSGWSLERLMLCCVQQANELTNAISASGPTPDYIPEYQAFQKLSEALRILQIDRHLQIELDKDGQSLLFHLQTSNVQRNDSASALFKELLGLDKTKDQFRVTAKRIPGSTDEVALTGRSLLSVMFFLSQSVEVPARHELEGKVTVTKYPDGKRFDWSSITGKVMRIRSGKLKPINASVKVFYRDTWFFIADNDLTSKTTFNLLAFLINLQAANKSGADPVLTYPVR